MPAWAPDWSKRILQPIGDFRERKAFRYNVSGNRSASCVLNMAAMAIDRFLYVVASSVIVDRIVRAGAAMKFQKQEIFDGK